MSDSIISKMKSDPPEDDYAKALQLHYDTIKQVTLANGVAATAYAGFLTSLTEKDRLNGFIALHGWFSSLVFLAFALSTAVGYAWMVFLADDVIRAGRQRFQRSRIVALVYVAMFVFAGTALFKWGLAYYEYVELNKFNATMDALHQHKEQSKTLP